MGQSDPKDISPEEYLRREVKALEKHEYFEGKIAQRALSSFNHVQIASNILFALHQELHDTNCYIFDSNMRILAPKINFYTYPDLMVVRGKFELAPGRDDVIINPFMLGEVMSPNTRDYDRGDKFERYRTFESLVIYLLVDEGAIYVECYQRLANDSWQLKAYNSRDQQIEFAGLGVELLVGSLYEHVEFPPKPAKRSREKNNAHRSIEINP